MSTETYREQVLRGEQLLDSYFDGAKDWRSQIDREWLDIAFCDRCVLGQLFGGYGNGLEKLYIWLDRKGLERPESPAEIGFSSENHTGLHRLTSLWRDRLSEHAWACSVESDLAVGA